MKKETKELSETLNSKEKLLLIKDFVTLENTFRITLSQIIGGAVVILGLYFSIENMITSQNSLILSQNGQITDRFTKAVNQLGDDNPDINIGGIYALDRIANDSEKDLWPIMEILMAYVRRKVPLNMVDSLKGSITNFGHELSYNRPRFDVQAAITVMIHQDLRHKNLKQQVIHLENSFLQGINFDKANFKNASFISTNCKASTFRNTILDSSYFSWGDLTGVTFQNASLQNVQLQNAILCYSYLDNVHLENADLSNADLRSSSMKKVYFNGAKITGARFDGVDLKGAIGLTKEQLSGARTDEYTNLPEYLK